MNLFRAKDTVHAISAPRRGVVLLTVVALLAVSMIVLGGIMRAMVQEHRQCRLRHEHRQARRISEAAVTRAAAQIAADTDYDGEQWRISAADLGMQRDAVVVIRLEQNETDGASPRTTIIATTTCPAGNAPRVRHTERTVLD